MGLRITTWNVNGIRNPFGYQPWRENKTFQAMFDTLEADIVIMQETKIQRKDLRDDMVLVPGWDVHFSLPKHKKGYSGVAVYTRSAVCCPIRAEEGITGILCPPNSSTKFRELPSEQQIGGYPTEDQLSSDIDEATLDSEGRCVILEFPAFVLLGVYSPAMRDETRAEFRQGFIDALDVRVRNLVALGKQVVLTGDLNIILSEKDTAGLAERLRKEDMTLDEFFSTPSRRFLNHLVFDGYVAGEREPGKDSVMWDLCRSFHPERKGMYTCWETRKNARPGNFGSRIDYILCTAGLKDWFVDANIQEGLLGSDHCPVYAILGDVVKQGGREMHVRDIMNPPGMFKNGTRLRELSTKDLLPSSAKLIPEFDRRQSIRDMFFRKASTSNAAATSASQADTKADGPDDQQDPPAPATIPSPVKSQVHEASLPLDDMPERSPIKSQPNASPSEPPTAQKRSAEPTKLTPRPLKKTKSATARELSKPVAGAGQTNLITGFFKPKTPVIPAKSTEGTLLAPEVSEGATPSTKSPSPKKPGSAQLDGVKESPSEKSSISNGDDTVFDPIVNKESWSKLLSGKRAPPKCEHEEPCISLLTKKPGVNCGRSFYICGRPLGPSGEKEKGTEWRCSTFIWSTDWNRSQVS